MSSSVVGTVGAVSDGVDAVAYGVSGGEIGSLEEKIHPLKLNISQA